jgi:hypothetical protein
MKSPFRSEEALDPKLELLRLRDEINTVSDELTASIKRLDGDVITARNDPEIRKIRGRLCRLHMKAMVSCAYDPINQEALARICDELTQPRACVKALQLSEEQTCCARFLRTMT